MNEKQGILHGALDGLNRSVSRRKPDDRSDRQQIKNAGAGTTMPWQNNRTLTSGSYTIMLEGRFVLKDGTFGAWGEVDSKSQGVDGDIETATFEGRP